MKRKIDNRTNLDIENEDTIKAIKLAKWIFAWSLVLVSVELIVGAIIWL